jgi:hypothetical protein
MRKFANRQGRQRLRGNSLGYLSIAEPVSVSHPIQKNTSTFCLYDLQIGPFLILILGTWVPRLQIPLITDVPSDPIALPVE